MDGGLSPYCGRNRQRQSRRRIMALYSRRMQIEQNFRDEKSPRFGFGLRLSRRQGKGRLAVLSVVAAMASLGMWQAGCLAEKKQRHLRYQANSIKDKRSLPYVRLAVEVLRMSLEY
nr:transposase [Raoultella terrigena]